MQVFGQIFCLAKAPPSSLSQERNFPLVVAQSDEGESSLIRRRTKLIHSRTASKLKTPANHTNPARLEN